MSEFDVILDNSQQNLREVPERILHMYNLKMLYLEGNSIKFLPDDFFPKLHRLTWLDLRNNKLGAIPETIAYHQHLENLLLSNNNIECLPNELGLVPTLKVLQIADNPLVYPDRKVIARGTKTICSYLKRRYEEVNPSREDVNEEKNEEIAVTEKTSNFPIKAISSDLMVRGVTTKQGDHNSITHKISREASKISLKSSYFNVADRVALAKGSLRENWVNKLKTLLNEQEKILQQEKNLKALTGWRLEKTMEPPRLVDESEIPEPPYGTYPECNRILSREDLSYQIDRMIRKSKNVPKRDNVQNLISQLLGQLKDVESNYNGSRSPRREMEEAGEQMKLIMDIHKKLLKLQKTNEIAL